MHREGHIGVGFIVYAPIAFLLFTIDASGLALLGGLIVAGGSMLPDLDMRVPFVRHRGPTHTVWFALFVAGVFGFTGVAIGASGGVVAVILFGLFGTIVGFVTVGAHLLADALTPKGLAPFEPIDDREYCFDVIRASNPVANYGLLALGGVTLAVLAAIGNAVNGLLT